MFWLVFKLLILPALCIVFILIASGAIALTGTSEDSGDDHRH